MITLTTLAGVTAYAATINCGRLFALPFALMAAAAVPVIALH